MLSVLSVVKSGVMGFTPAHLLRGRAAYHERSGMILVVMGVCGSGKTVVGERLAERLGLPFFDADDFHSPENKSKMSRGIPLTDEDRLPWLSSLKALLGEHDARGEGLVLACSALREKFRVDLRSAAPARPPAPVAEPALAGRDLGAGGAPGVTFVYLKGDRSVIAPRMAARKGHYMNPALLDSQYEALEEPADAITVDVDAEPDVIVENVMAALRAAEQQDRV